MQIKELETDHRRTSAQRAAKPVLQRAVAAIANRHKMHRNRACPGQAKGQLQGVEIERDRLVAQVVAGQQERQGLERQLAERVGVQSALNALLSRRHGVPHLDDVHRAIAKHFEIDALSLEELILAALENKGRIPAAIRKRYKAKMPEGLVEAIEAEVRGRLSPAISGR